MAKLIDLSKGYLPIVLVAAMLASCISASYWLSTMASSVEHNTSEIVQIGEKLEALPQMTTDIALIKYELGINDEKTAMVPFRSSLD